ncbi:MAG: Hsp20/alpha crystallin family protein [Candidatus Methanoperedens sp.]|nr:Hsp20/alpha crystallin family protein [Candidatus Methanoperedens sp.]MCZ7405453.1 Hsp20/alpha crystallin family protein [Candidatus Methanoperedens sp.]
MFEGWKRTDKGIFEEFEKQMEEMNELMEKMMHEAGREPLVYGYSMHIGPDGIPHVEQFGNVRQDGLPQTGGLQAPKEQDVREPFASSIIDEKNKELCITVEMPGVRKEDIELNATENQLVIKADSNGRKYFKTITNPSPVVPDSAGAKYNNGVLEITLKLKGRRKPEGKAVKIE